MESRKSLLLRSLTALSLTAVLIVGMTAAAQANPRINFTVTTIDLGAIGQGESHDLTYNFRNTGTTNLEIRNVSSSCGCTNVRSTADVVRPGQTASVKGTFNSGTFRGQNTKTINVSTNDPNNPNVRLTVTANIRPAVAVSPEQVNFGTLKKGRVHRQTLILRPENPDTFQIRSVEARADFITAGPARKSTSINGAWELPVVVNTANARSGRIFEMVQVRTNISLMPIVVVRVLGTIED